MQVAFFWVQNRCIIGPDKYPEVIFEMHSEFSSYFDTVFENRRKSLFNIATKASYVYILCGQKLIKNAKNGPFGRVFENLKLAVKLCYQTGQF